VNSDQKETLVSAPGNTGSRASAPGELKRCKGTRVKKGVQDKCRKNWNPGETFESRGPSASFTMIRIFFSLKTKPQGWGCSSVMECLPSIHKVLGPIFNTNKTKIMNIK
jgi:hypothetical protein